MKYKKYNEKVYHFRVQVLNPDKTKQIEDYQILEPDTRFGEAMATGKVVSYYEGLREKKTIADFRILY